MPASANVTSHHCITWHIIPAVCMLLEDYHIVHALLSHGVGLELRSQDVHEQTLDAM